MVNSDLFHWSIRTLPVVNSENFYWSVRTLLVVDSINSSVGRASNSWLQGHGFDSQMGRGVVSLSKYWFNTKSQPKMIETLLTGM